MQDAALRAQVRHVLDSVKRQHQELGELEAELLGAIEQHDAFLIERWFRRYAKALQAHFSLEEGLLFPALRLLDPEWVAPVHDLEHQHQCLRGELIAIEAKSNAYAVASGLAALRVRIAEHERQEEALAKRAVATASPGEALATIATHSQSRNDLTP